MRISVLGRLRDLQYIFTVMYGTPSISEDHHLVKFSLKTGKLYNGQEDREIERGDGAPRVQQGRQHQRIHPRPPGVHFLTGSYLHFIREIYGGS